MDADTYVLVVDDDPHLLTMLSALIDSMGIPVEAARDGVEALELMREKMPGFVVLDLMMPRMDGFSVLGRLKLDPEKRSIPILVLTAAHLDPDQELELRGLVLDVVQKGDMDLQDIGRLIEETLKGA